MTSGDPPAGPPEAGPFSFTPIPVLKSLRAGFDAVYRGRDSFFAAARAWAVIVGVILGIAETADRVAPDSVVSHLLDLVAFAASLIGTVAFLVAWHRHVLLGERISVPGPLRVGAREIRFLIYELAPMALIAAVLLMAGAGLATPFFLVPAFAAILVLTVRWMLFAPLAALDIPGNLLAHAWKLSRGNGFRLFGGLWMMIFILLVPYFVVSIFVAGISAVAATAGILLGFLVQLTVSIGIAFLDFVVIAWFAGFLCYSFAAIMQRTLPLDPNDAGIFPAARS